jgi:hypothetical protein
MICSRAEAYALVLKAARGAGLPLGHCEDLANAMKIAPSPVWEVLPDALGGEFALAVPDEIDGRLVYEISRIAIDGPSAIDAALSGQEVYLGRLDVPLLLVMLCHVAEEAVEQGFEYTFDEDGGVLLRLSGRAPDRTTMQDGRADIPENVFGFLNILAAKTYVPESEASRVSGAGAGLTDND